MSNRLDRTQELPTEKMYRPGVAGIPPIRPREAEPPIARVATRQRPRLPLRVRLRNLRSGGRWSGFGAAVLVISWALWAAQAGRQDLANEALVLVLILLVALGLFAVLRLAGGVVFERVLSRSRRGALLSHVAIGLFLAFAGISLLQQVDWVVNAWNHVRGMR